MSLSSEDCVKSKIYELVRDACNCSSTPPKSDIIVYMKDYAIKKGYMHCECTEYEFDITDLSEHGRGAEATVSGVHYWLEIDREYEFYSEIKNDDLMDYMATKLLF